MSTDTERVPAPGASPRPSEANPLALAGFLLSLPPVFPLFVAGVVVSHVALKRSRAVGSGRGLAIAGLVVGYAWVLLVPLCTVLIVVLGAAFFTKQHDAPIVASVADDVRQSVQPTKDYLESHGLHRESSADRAEGLTDARMSELPERLLVQTGSNTLFYSIEEDSGSPMYGDLLIIGSNPAVGSLRDDDEVIYDVDQDRLSFSGTYAGLSE